MHPVIRSSARGVAVLALAAALFVPAVEAKVGGGSSMGSRGGRTYSAPAPTATAPKGAQPMQRTETPNVGQTAPGSMAGAAAQPRKFGFGTGMMAGLLGAGVLGMLGGGGSARVAPEAPVQIGPSDYAEFERALVEIQTAYGREDMNALTHMATTEMVRYFGSDLEADRSKGLRNQVSDPKLLQGDLAESWREGPAEYATVAMRFSVVDATVERATGRVVSGDATRPIESVEHWTFRRENGGSWLLSAIQQAG